MRALVTGASGFIGSHVVAALAGSGTRVRAFDRQPIEPALGPANVPADADIEFVAGDVLDPAALGRALRGCDAVFHLAAVYSYRRADRAAMHAVNVEGTRRVLDLVAAAPQRLRMVMTSSCATCGPVAGRRANEGDEPPAWELKVAYKRTKLAAERLALAAASRGMDVVAVNPTTPVGPGDRRPTPTGKMVADVVAGRIGAYVETALNVVAVEDVAAGHLLAYEQGRSGERYLLGGEDMTLARAFATIARHAGRRAPRWHVPYPVALGAAHAAALAGRALQREPDLLVLDGVRLARLPMRFDDSRARRELGYESRPADEALAAAVDWFRNAGGAPRAGGRVHGQPVSV